MKENEESEYFIEGAIKSEDDYKYDSNETGVSEVDHFYENIKKIGAKMTTYWCSCGEDSEGYFTRNSRRN